MGFLFDNPDLDGSIESMMLSHKRYAEYLESIRPHISQVAYAFAAAPWHYNYDDHRCPHDAWLEQCAIIERSSGDRQQFRHIDIVIKLLGAYHDGFIELTYTKVKSYNFAMETSAYGEDHSDWLTDELRWADGFLLHDIVFENARWLISCEDLSYTWHPLDETRESLSPY